MSRLRSLDSKISFFAFADIITAVSGVLIFVALLLATDLGIPTDSHTSSSPEAEQQIQEILAQQVDVDAQNERWQELLTMANTSPDAAKLQADIQRLQAQLAGERKKQAALTVQMSDSEAAMAKRDADLGLTALKVQIQKENDETKTLAAKESAVERQKAALEQHVAGLQSQLLQLRQRAGKLWLIPEQGTATKEPILATVSGHGIKIERFDHPELTRQFEQSTARWDFGKYLEGVKGADEYVVFLLRPSGIALFQDLVQAARDKGIDVGYDALEENKDVYFATPPVLDETVPVVTRSGNTSGSDGFFNPAGEGGAVAGTNGGYGNGTPGPPGLPLGESATGNAGSNGTVTGNHGPAENTSSSAATTGAGSANGAATGKDNGSKSATNSTPGKTAHGTATTNATSPSSSSEKEKPKTTNAPTAKPPPPPVVKSWWQRLLEWLASLF